MDARVLISETSLPDMDFMKQGKVRNIYDFGDTLLIVATDRISAFDVVMDDPIPDKGRILTQISAFWFKATDGIIANHMISTSAGAFPPECQSHREILKGRSMWVRKADPLPVECIVRGYLAGSGLKEYRQTGAICGIGLPPGLWESERLPQPIFTPSTKAEGGAHDINISFDQMVEIIGDNLSQQLHDVSLALYEKGPKIRTGKLKDCKPVMLTRNAIISFTTKKVSGTCDLFSTTYAYLVADVKKDKNLLVEKKLIKQGGCDDIIGLL